MNTNIYRHSRQSFPFPFFLTELLLVRWQGTWLKLGCDSELKFNETLKIKQAESFSLYVGTKQQSHIKLKGQREITIINLDIRSSFIHP